MNNRIEKFGCRFADNLNNEINNKQCVYYKTNIKRNLMKITIMILFVI